MKLDWLGCWAGDLECLHCVESVAFLVVCCARIVDCNFLGLRIEGVWSALCLCPEDEVVGLALDEAELDVCLESCECRGLMECSDMGSGCACLILIDLHYEILCSETVTDGLGLHSRKFCRESHAHFLSVRRAVHDHLLLIAAQCQHCQRCCKNVLRLFHKIIGYLHTTFYVCLSLSLQIG